jgi:NADPH:quinone reductase-like Zn-dependent oxidoreductase
MTDIPATMRQLRSLVTSEAELQLSVATVDTPTPGPRDVLVRVEAAPVNPSDLGLLLAMADVSQAVAGGSADEPTVTAPVPEAVMRSLAARVGRSMPVGNEGAGVVVAAGSSPEAEALLGRTVGFAGGATYAE